MLHQSSKVVKAVKAILRSLMSALSTLEYTLSHLHELYSPQIYFLRPQPGWPHLESDPWSNASFGMVLSQSCTGLNPLFKASWASLGRTITILPLFFVHCYRTSSPFSNLQTQLCKAVQMLDQGPKHGNVDWDMDVIYFWLQIWIPCPKISKISHEHTITASMNVFFSHGHATLHLVFVRWSVRWSVRGPSVVIPLVHFIFGI